MRQGKMFKSPTKQLSREPGIGLRWDFLGFPVDYFYNVKFLTVRV
jgi:hypothetical protein